ncbi:transcription antitermination factor NusB [Roseimaritima sediminicola]|uniref:transcription antitermination factor NusB n=1 Tax=Roseimaritima sediminicola TaxID=2662066 RepID=UPI0012985640|nr:transcription antitermination factor NusB [Roseimaritima sediminicola]
MATRRRAREIVLQLLYEADVNPGREPESSYAFLRSRMQGRKALTKFGDQLLVGTLEHRQQIDEQIGKLTTNWSLSRMAIIDRNILRLGAYEILFGDTPGSVAITEALALASRYGDKNSPRFINGVLDKVLKNKRTGAAP